MKSFIAAFFGDEAGATAIEYGLIVALISVAMLAILVTLGDQIAATFTTLSEQFETQAGIAPA